jgi:hypothetical protein
VLVRLVDARIDQIWSDGIPHSSTLTCRILVLAKPMGEEVSALGPVDPSSVRDEGQEKAAPWVVRKLAGVCERSLLGRREC